MTKVHHLTSKLKALKLGGMLDTLELRLEQARTDRLGYVEFLELLLEDEVQRRANNISKVISPHYRGIIVNGGDPSSFCHLALTLSTKTPAWESGVPSCPCLFAIASWRSLCVPFSSTLPDWRLTTTP